LKSFNTRILRKGSKQDVTGGGGGGNAVSRLTGPIFDYMVNNIFNIFYFFINKKRVV
jgi:hypothetical protein